MAEPLLELRDLRVAFPTSAGEVRAVDGVSLTLERERILGVVGESGAGKSALACAIPGILEPPGRVTGGEIRFDGRDLVNCPAGEMLRLRGGKIGMVFQDPMTSLNPVYTVGSQLCEAIRLHLPLRGAQARARAQELLGLVGVDAPARRLRQYPHELSGGMRQRVMIAMALCCEPELLIADEPTTALDVTIQAQILALLRKLRRELGMSVLLVTHDLGVIAQTCDEVAVMYAGRIVERGRVEDVLLDARHEYTRGLLRCVPSRERAHARLSAIPGGAPDAVARQAGCPFAPRCAEALRICLDRQPEEVDFGAGHRAACWKNALPEGEGGVAV